MKYILSFMFVFLSMTLIAQTSINDYKYVVVPKSYEFSQEQDQYQLNSLSKFLFEKHVKPLILTLVLSMLSYIELSNLVGHFLRLLSTYIINIQDILLQSQILKISNHKLKSICLKYSFYIVYFLIYT